MTWAPLLAAAPWLAAVVVVLWRITQSRHLDDYPADAPSDAPLLSVIVPARNEATNITRCVTSLLASTYPSLDIIVVDDHSTDDTAALARSAGASDARLRVVGAPDLAPGWLGKQWACAHGAALARGSVLCFTDADTVHAPDLHVRSVRALLDRGADMLSVAGMQELGTFWERLVQPQVFALLFARYGGTEVVSRATRPEDVIANGQYMLFRRSSYDALGGHASVRGKVAEDLALAMRAKQHGMQVHLIQGLAQLSTRMYASLGALIRGWMKNVYAGGIETLPPGRIWRLLYPLMLLAPIVVWLAPPLVLALWAAGLTSDGVGTWALVTSIILFLWWLIVYTAMTRRPWYALVGPMGNLLLGYIFLRAIARGTRVEWKGREYDVGQR
ncbi:MAG TPA: glycosyltransferase [Gemmatimonadaceae bacterium]|nr:glycosyltransferase [Gemmatimonadaceae bacterium]